MVQKHGTGWYTMVQNPYFCANSSSQSASGPIPDTSTPTNSNPSSLAPYASIPTPPASPAHPSPSSTASWNTLTGLVFDS